MLFKYFNVQMKHKHMIKVPLDTESLLEYLEADGVFL